MNHIIDVLATSPEVSLNSIPNESPSKSIGHRHYSSLTVIADKCDNVAPFNLLAEGQSKPPTEGAGFDSPETGVHKSQLVDKYFPDKRTGPISLQQDTF